MAELFDLLMMSINTHPALVENATQLLTVIGLILLFFGIIGSSRYHEYCEREYAREKVRHGRGIGDR